MTIAAETQRSRERVLLLVRRQRDRELLVDHLGDEYDVVTATPDEAWTEFDCCLVGSAWYGEVEEELREHRAAAEPVYLPVLLLVQGEVGEALAATDDALFDDVLGLPASRAELDARVESALHTRELSLELASERDRFVALTEGASDAILTVDEAGIVRYANPALEGMLGYPSEELVGEPLVNLIPERFRDAHESAFEAYHETGERTVDWSSVEFVARHADGHEVPIDVSLSEYEADDGRRLTAIVRDVTERKEREQALAEREQLFRSVFEGSFDAMVLTDDEGRYVEVNEAACELFGLEREELLGRSVAEFTPEAYDFETVWNEFLEEGGERGEFELVRPDGETRIVEFSATPNIVSDRHLSVLRDVTERKERERERERLVDLLENAEQLADLGSWEFDLETETVELSETVAWMYGYPTDEDQSIDELTVEELLAPYTEESQERLSATVERVVDGDGAGVIDLELELEASAPVDWVRIYGQLTVADGEPGTIRGAVQNVTERRERERSLERALDRLDRAQAIADLGAWEHDLDSEEIYWTSGMYRIHGVPDSFEPTPESVPGRYHPDDRERLLDAFETVITEGSSFDMELRLATDEERWVHMRCETVTDDGWTTMLRGTVQDITGRKRQEHELRRTLEQLNQAQVTADVGGWEYDPNAGDLVWTRHCYRVHGIDPDSGFEPTPEAIRELAHPDDRDRLDAALRAAIVDGEPFGLDVRIRPPGTDERRWVHVHGRPEREDGRTVLVRGVSQDITERKAREREMESTREQLQQAVTATRLRVWELDRATETVTIAARGTGSLIGLERDEFDLEAFLERVHPDHRERFQAALADTLAGERHLREEVRAHNSETGEWRWLELSGDLRTDVEDPVVIGTSRDVTERKERAETLERTVDLFQKSQEIADVAGWEYDPGMDEIRLTDHALDVVGAPGDGDGPLDLETALSFYHPEDRPEVRAGMERLLETGQSFDMEVRLSVDGGDPTWVRTQGERVEREDGRTVLRGALQNVTERKEREQELERYETIVEASPDPIYAIDTDGTFTLVNPALAETFDRTPESLLGADVGDLLDPAQAEQATSLVESLVEGDREQGSVELPFDTPAGRREIEVNISLLEDDDGTVVGTVGVARDVTELRQRERHISVLDRVLRHNLRNKMNVVLGHVAEFRSADDEAVREAAASIVEAGQELLALSDAARSFHDTIHADEPVEEVDVVDRVEHVLREAELEYPTADLHADLPMTARARATESFELALTEVVENAIVHGGDAPTVTVTVERDGEAVLVRVVDDGPGLDDLERRALEKGVESPLEHTSGLGLWLVRWAVKASGGSLAITDREPTGTVVELRVPAAD